MYRQKCRWKKRKNVEIRTEMFIQRIIGFEHL